MEKAKTGNRRLIPVGGSIGLTLPRNFLREKGWQAGDRVNIVYDDIVLVIRMPNNKGAENHEPKPKSS